MAFEVGQKVVCVDDSLPANPWHQQHMIVKGQIYTVMALEGPKCISIDSSRRAWQNWRFRPLVARKTDIGFAYEILRKVSKKAPALTNGVRNHD
jgi:hypothetical protein